MKFYSTGNLCQLERASEDGDHIGYMQQGLEGLGGCFVFAHLYIFYEKVN